MTAPSALTPRAVPEVAAAIEKAPEDAATERFASELWRRLDNASMEDVVYYGAA